MYYHVWFVTKYRKSALSGNIQQRIQTFFSEIIEKKKYTVLAQGMDANHVHLLCCARDRSELANMIRTLKAVSAKKILEESKDGERKHFWARKYGCKRVYENQLADVLDYIRSHRK